jgi:hypothetical protein
MENFDKKIISFSVWQSDLEYAVGALANAIYAHQVYPGWKCRFYIPKDFNKEVVDRLKDINYVETVETESPKENDFSLSLSKYLALSDTDAEFVIFRNCESRIGYREKELTDEWINSDKNAHIIYDHPHLPLPIPNGCLGIKGGIIKDIDRTISDFLASLTRRPWESICSKNRYDEITYNQYTEHHFLKNVIYPSIENSVLRHDEFIIDFNGEKIGTEPKNKRKALDEFIGEHLTVFETPKDNNLRLYSSANLTEINKSIVDNIKPKEKPTKQKDKEKELLYKLAQTKNFPIN